MDKEYKKILEEIKYKFPNLYIDNSSEEKSLKILASFYNLNKNSPIELNKNILKEAMFFSKNYFEPKNLNDFYFILFSAIKNNKDMVKLAYPQAPLIASEPYPEPFDLSKWSGLVYRIYNDVANGVGLNQAIDCYAAELNKESGEDLKFKRWIKFHIDKEGEKYASEEDTMKKKSFFNSSLGPSKLYYPDTIPVPGSESKEPINKIKEDIHTGDKIVKDDLSDWFKKLDRSIRVIDKLIRSTPKQKRDKLIILKRHLNLLDDQIQEIKTSQTANDIVIKTANSFKNEGFNDGYDILIKLAQEMEPATPTEAQAPPANADESPEDISQEVSSDPVKKVFEGIEPEMDKYQDISGDIELSDAIQKLEEVAARLSDRRVIRLLAEFDIMLDKIGIASMFPELAESQSKLIDSYSYALVRVTKMLGMLSSGKSLSEISQSKSDELAGKVKREVNKTFEAEPSPGEDKQQAIQQEFQE